MSENCVFFFAFISFSCKIEIVVFVILCLKKLVEREGKEREREKTTISNRI